MDICSFELCSGCSLCADACPRDAIRMEKDSEGFFRPEINNELCVECGICSRVCPVNKRAGKEERELQVFAAYAKDKSVSERSSTAGVFHYLAKSVLSSGGVVFGAGYEGTTVVHKGIDSDEELFELMGSKYVQSDTRGIYKKLKAFLSEGRIVLFAGTPCQCAAVRNYVGECENLILMDIICHGVPSPELWNKYITENFSDVKSISFRDKKRGWEEYSMKIESEKGTYSCSAFKDPYLRMFAENFALRTSCYNCSWKGENYYSDITVGDFWGIYKSCPKMYCEKGTSAVIVRSEKGERLFSEISDNFVVHSTTLEAVESINISYRVSTKCPPKRKEFFKSIEEGSSFKELHKKYTVGLSGKEIVKNRVKNSVKRTLVKIHRLKSK